MLLRFVSALKDTLAQERERWILWFPVGLGCGTGLYFWLNAEPNCVTIGVVSFISCLIAFTLRRTFTGLLIGSIVLGLCIAKIRTQCVHTLMLTEKTHATFQGRVISIEQFPHKSRALIEVLQDTTLPKRVRLTFDKAQSLNPGDVLHVSADLFPLPDPLSPQGYDFRRAAFFQGIGAGGRISLIHTQSPAPPWFRLESIRSQLTQQLRRRLPGENGEIAAALVTGDRSSITPSTRQAYADAGIAHILAISGLHLSLVAGLCFLTIRRGLCLCSPLAERYAIKKGAAACAILFTALYLALSGFATPAKRAFIMTSLVLGGILLDRQALSMRSLAIAATGILILWPESLLTASFQLSFAAVVALVAAYEWKSQRSERRSGWRKVLIYFIEIGFTTLIATAATTPFTIALFNRFTLQAILANLIAIPLTGLWIMPLAVVATLSLLVGGWGWAFTALGWGLTLLTNCALRISALPGAIILVPTPSPFFIIAITLGGLWICLWQKSWRKWGIIPIGLAIASLYFTHPPDALIAGDGSLIAVRQGRTLWLSSERQASLYKAFWIKELGLSQTHLWPTRYFAPDTQTLFVDKRWIHKKEAQTLCDRYKIMVTNGYLKRYCQPNQIIIDRNDLREGGTLALWFNPSGIIIQSVRRTFGSRPWSAS